MNPWTKLLCLFSTATCVSAQTNLTFPLWADGAPGALGQETKDIPTLTVYLPAPEKATGAAFVICPGGSYSHLADHEGSHYARWFNEMGIAGFVLKYRLGSNGYRHPAMLQDATRALRLVRARADEWKLDSKRIGIIGSSAGGHLASLLGTTNSAENKESSVEAVLNWCGLSDLMTVSEQSGSRTKIDWDDKNGPLAKFLGGRETEKPDLAKAASPVNFITSDDPPFLIVHGDIDDVVPFAQSQELYDKLKEKGVPCRLIKVKGGGHIFGNDEEFKHAMQFFQSTIVKGRREFVLED